MTKKSDEFRKYYMDTHDDIESMFELFSRLKRPFAMPSESRWLPEVDVFDTDEEFVIIMDIAHIDPKDIEVLYKNKALFIKGVRREMTGFKKRHYHKMEIDYGPFERRIAVPISIDEQNIKTKYKDGFLQIRLKKVAERRVKERKIDIDWKE
ncbi:Hsp20/alpha crystallin family protein [candidate division KSB1 bacterium]